MQGTAKPKGLAKIWREVKRPFKQGIANLLSIRPKIQWKTGAQSFIVPYVEVSITTLCTLKCKNCGLYNTNYYFDSKKLPQNFETQSLKTCIENFMDAVDGISVFRLIGGEPFLHPDWDKLLQMLCQSNKVENAEIISNGTFIPSVKKLNVLKHQKVNVVISDYGSLSIQKDAMVAFFVHNQIKYRISNCINDGWWNPGDNRDRMRSFEDRKSVFNSCYLAKKCKHILDGKLFVCSRDAHGQNLGIFPKSDPSSYTCLQNTINLRERIKSIYNCEAINSCNYCDGTHNSNPKLKAAAQYSNEDLVKLRSEQKPE